MNKIWMNWIWWEGLPSPTPPTRLRPPSRTQGNGGVCGAFFLRFLQFFDLEGHLEFFNTYLPQIITKKSKIEGFGKPKRFQNESEIDPKSRSDKRRRFHRIWGRFVMFVWLADLPILCAHAVFPKLFRSFAFSASDLLRDQKTCHKRSRNHHETTVQIQFENERFSIAIF